MGYPAEIYKTLTVDTAAATVVENSKFIDKKSQNTARSKTPAPHHNNDGEKTQGSSMQNGSPTKSHMRRGSQKPTFDGRESSLQSN